MLLSFSRDGALSLSKIGHRLQVHATSVTNVIDRLEAAGLVRREPNPFDGRGTLAVLTARGRAVAQPATVELTGARFGLDSLAEAELDELFTLLRRVRVEAEDFTA